MSRKRKDITGQTFGSLTAKSYSYSSANHLAFWDYVCACGKQHTARANTVAYVARKGDPELPSCGCIEKARKTKHGFRTVKDTHPLYRTYRGMMTRCYDPNDSSYKWYGAIGVAVCAEWLNNPEAFIKWGLANGWSKEYQIDKDILCDSLQIHPHIYSPTTCQFVSAKVNVGYACNRDTYGKHPNVKLSHADVEEILRLYFSGEETNQSALARQFGLLAPSSVGRLIQLEKKRINDSFKHK